MHESRTHSNLWGKMVHYGDKALECDHFGYYKPVLAGNNPTTTTLTEQYPHMVTPWIYDHHFLDQEFNYEDEERKYIDSEANNNESATELKQKLDEHH